MFPEKNRVVNINTLVGKTCKIVGDIITKESIRIDGHIVGNVESDSVASITETAVMEGNIKAGEVFVAGKVKGNITALKSLEMEKTAFITGDIFTSKLHVHAGATFNGHAKMGENVKPVETKNVHQQNTSKLEDK